MLQVRASELEATENAKKAERAAHEAEWARKEESAARLGALAQRDEAQALLEKVDIFTSEARLRNLATGVNGLYPIALSGRPATVQWIHEVDQLFEKAHEVAGSFLSVRREEDSGEMERPVSVLHERLRVLREHIARDEGRVGHNLVKHFKLSDHDILHIDQLKAQAHEVELAIVNEPRVQYRDQEGTIKATANAIIDTIRLIRGKHGAMAEVKEIIASLDRIEEVSSAKKAQEAWAKCIKEVEADPVYGGLKLVDQEGLLPLGKNPRTGLQEFSHILSSAPGAEWPGERNPNGGFTVTKERGLIFVLLPGGKTQVGVQGRDPKKPLFGKVGAKWGQVHTLNLDPFFASKYELTQAQWGRLNRGRVQCFSANLGRHTWPADSVSYVQAESLMSKYLMEVPSCAQWEYACRGGTTTPWPFGTNKRDIAKFANIYDPKIPVGIRNVGGKLPNNFGLFDMIGNVQEWTTDQIPFDHPRSGDGKVPDNGEREVRQIRGGGYATDPNSATSFNAMVGIAETDGAMPNGFRPIRRLFLATKGKK